MRNFFLLFLCASAIATTACFPQNQCSGTFSNYCATNDATCMGHFTDATHWESNPIEGTWLVFGHESTILMHFNDPVSGAPFTNEVLDVSIAITTVSNPYDAGQPQVPSAGNVSEWNVNTDDNASLFVKNDTCADYFVRVFVTFAAPPSPDASPE